MTSSKIKFRQINGLIEILTDLKRETVNNRKILEFIRANNEKLVFPTDLQLEEISEEVEKEIQEKKIE